MNCYLLLQLRSQTQSVDFTFTYSCSLLCWSRFLTDLIFWLTEEILLTFLSRKVCWWQVLSNFIWLESLHFYSPLQEHLTGIEFGVKRNFFLSTLCFSLPPVLACIVSEGKSDVIQIFASQWIRHTSPYGFLKIFSLSLFSAVWIWHAQMECSGIYSAQWFLWFGGCCEFWQIFSHYYFKYFFFLLFWYSLFACVTIFIVIPYSWGFCLVIVTHFSLHLGLRSLYNKLQAHSFFPWLCLFVDEFFKMFSSFPLQCLDF